MDNSLNVAGEQSRGASLAVRGASPRADARRIAFRTAGRLHGPIVRLVSPSDLGEVLKPFVFLDHGVIESTNQPLFGSHPHSGIATLTVLLTGALAYEDTTGTKGELAAGGLEWMKAGHGVWHDGRILPGEAARFFQLWIALPAAQENLPAESQYVAPSEVQQDGPVRVLLGEYGRARSPIRAPEGIHYFHVRLQHGQRWRYVPPAHHTIAWLAVDEGRLLSAEPIHAGQLAAFEESSSDPIETQADGDTSFVIGSAVKHPHPLVRGSHSVHTSESALAQGEAEIRRIGHQLRAEGRR
jgi:redox-sensitive bicupin YhaK (pirin superfamily)